MKNLPIVGKILTVLGVFGVFVIAVAFYVTSQMNVVDSAYLHLRHGPSAATRALIQASSNLRGMSGAIGRIMIDTTDAENQTDVSELATYKDAFGQHMDEAAAASPGDAAAIADLKSRGLQAVNGDCANSIRLGASSTVPPATAQAAYLKECAPAFQALVPEIAALDSRLQNRDDAAAASIETTAHSAIVTTFILILVGLVLMMLSSFSRSVAGSWRR